MLFAKDTPEWQATLMDPANQFLGYLLKNGHASSSQIFQDIWVLFETGEKRGGFFVEFGATNGKLISNSYLLETGYGWNGILAEPAPVWHEELSRNRKCLISHKCVWTKSGETLFFRQTKEPEYSTLDSFSKRGDAHASAREDAELIQVETISLNDLLTECIAPTTIDYISLDTEGSELSILETFDFDHYNVRHLSIEHNHTEDEVKIDRFMASKGFERCFPEFSLFDGWFRNTRDV
jgi:FkbM family methyltransferase